MIGLINSGSHWEAYTATKKALACYRKRCRFYCPPPLQLLTRCRWILDRFVVPETQNVKFPNGTFSPSQVYNSLDKRRSQLLHFIDREYHPESFLSKLLYQSTLDFCPICFVCVGRKREREREKTRYWTPSCLPPMINILLRVINNNKWFLKGRTRKGRKKRSSQ